MQRLPPHPGTSAGRAKAAFNPQIPASEFENRFLATKSRLESQAWDFIVVGAGSAGCVLASRLSRNPKVKVLLVEAGGEVQNAARIKDPRCALGLWGCEADWNFESSPQPQLLPAGRIIPLERGKGLGGSSLLNYSMWVRGTPEDFNRWDTECGCGDLWSYESVRPNFDSIERMFPGNLGSTEAGDRGMTGEMTPAVLWPPLPEAEAFKTTAEKVFNLPVLSDYNGPQGLAGVCDTQQSVTLDRCRADAFTVFVEPCLRSRPNLCVASEAYTRRVLFEGTRCVGIEVQCSDHSLVEVRSRLEVILSAGAINSPQLLMLSGIGDAIALGKLGIPVLADVPAVGRHLQDHPVIAVPFSVPESVNHMFVDGSPAGTSGLNTIAFFKSTIDEERDKQRGSASGQDMEMIFVSRFDHRFLLKVMSQTFPLGKYAGMILAKLLLYLPSIREKLAQTAYLAVEYNHPLSRGSVQLRSADPLQPPMVDVALLREPSDLDAVIEAAKKVREMLRTEPLSQFVGAMEREPELKTGFFSDGLQDFMKADDAQLRAYFLRTVSTTWHYSCSARMGAADAPLTEAALDPRLRVRRVSGLRVADQSVTPFVVSGNTNASAMMIGDKAAQIIYEDHGLCCPRSAL